eukprot:m.37354 g.37354  ORF g.37354 m.37354 type:complete len:378 (-) comp9306_c0_seq2:54-1187(-)
MEFKLRCTVGILLVLTWQHVESSSNGDFEIYQMCGGGTSIGSQNNIHPYPRLFIINGPCLGRNGMKAPSTVSVCIPPKAGTTSFLVWLRDVANIRTQRQRDLHQISKMDWRGPGAKLHVSSTTKYQPIYADDSVHKIIILRHPVSRFISAYKSKYFCGPRWIFKSDRHDAPRMIGKLAHLFKPDLTNHTCLTLSEYIDVMSVAESGNHPGGKNNIMSMEPHSSRVSRYCQLELGLKHNATVLMTESDSKVKETICKMFQQGDPDFPCSSKSTRVHESRKIAPNPQIANFEYQAEFYLQRIKDLLVPEIKALSQWYEEDKLKDEGNLEDIKNILFQESRVDMECVKRTFNKDMVAKLRKSQMLDSPQVTCIKAAQKNG